MHTYAMAGHEGVSVVVQNLTEVAEVRCGGVVGCKRRVRDKVLGWWRLGAKDMEVR